MEFLLAKSAVTVALLGLVPIAIAGGLGLAEKNRIAIPTLIIGLTMFIGGGIASALCLIWR